MSRSVPTASDLATASQDNTARIWDAASSQELARLTHEGPVWSVAFSPDGQWLATASSNPTARVSYSEVLSLTVGTTRRGSGTPPAAENWPG
ncbi:MAG: hypothetical protein MZV65_14235 [Chromatiales bacterium]|nr:hypothetical protein [Chromatiales bacterium]